MAQKHKNSVSLFHQASALAVLLAAGAAASGCSHPAPADTTPVSASSNVPAAAAPMAAPAGTPRDPHVSPMSAEDQAMMKQKEAEDKGAPP